MCYTVPVHTQNHPPERRNTMLYLSKQLLTHPLYRTDGVHLCATLARRGITPTLLGGTKDIWLRDFMPVKTKSGRYVLFRYQPGYLTDSPELVTDFHTLTDISLQTVESSLRLDGGNVVFSPKKERVIVSERVFDDNPDRSKQSIAAELQDLLEAEVIFIPCLKSDMTGHADGMVRFVDEAHALGNGTPFRNGLEQKIKRILAAHGITVTDFPYMMRTGGVGCYLNYFETAEHIFLPIFGLPQDEAAVRFAEQIFTKPICPVKLTNVAKAGGALNCITWED